MALARDPWPTPRRRFSDRQREVLDALEEVFLRRGLKPVTLSDLTVAAGCSRSTLYDIGAGKDQLFLIVVDRILRRITARGRAAMDELQDPIDQVTAMATTAADELGSLGPTFLNAVLDCAPAMRIYESYLADSRDYVAALVQSAVDQGVIAPVHAHTIAETTVVLALHFAGPGSRRGPDISASQALSEAYAVLMAGLRHRAPVDTPA